MAEVSAYSRMPPSSMRYVGQGTRHVAPVARCRGLDCLNVMLWRVFGVLTPRAAVRGHIATPSPLHPSPSTETAGNHELDIFIAGRRARRSVVVVVTVIVIAVVVLLGVVVMPIPAAVSSLGRFVLCVGCCFLACVMSMPCITEF